MTPGLAAGRRAARVVATAQDVDPARRVFNVWLLIYASVGAQMSWVLRPFVGDPALPFQLFRPRGDNFFIGVAQCLRDLFS